MKPKILHRNNKFNFEHQDIQALIIFQDEVPNISKFIMSQCFEPGMLDLL